MKVVFYILLLISIEGCSFFDDAKENNSSSTTNTQYNSLLWHLFFTDSDTMKLYSVSNESHINAKKSWELSKGAGVKIAVIDETFEPLHEDIIDGVYATYNITDETTNVTNSATSSSHGHSCAGMIGARDNLVGTIGIAPESQLILIGANLQYDSQLILAFDKAVELGAQVISCSWGSYQVSDTLAAKIQEVHDAGVVIVFAAGNDNCSLDTICSGITSPSDESELNSVIGVGGSGENNDRVSYSNYGSKIDILAPAGDKVDYLGILGVDDIGSDGSNDQFGFVDENYAFIEGTSFSAPLVAGVAGLMLSVNPNLTPDEIRTIIIETASKIGIENGAIYDNTGFNTQRAYGKINAYSAVLRAINY